jgi:hypothetical protein
MARAAVNTGYREVRVGPFSGPPVRVSWGAIIAGAVAALAVGILLHALGFALGLSAIDPRDPSTLRGSGLFTGIWSLITSFVALFVGGAVASRGSGVWTRGGGAIHGLVMWGLTTLIGTWLTLAAAANLLGGVFSVGKTAVEGGAGAVAAAAGSAGGAAKMAQNLGIDAKDALEPVNQRLRAEGKPEITPDQLQAATASVAQNAVRQGKIDRSQLVNSIAEHTALSRADAEAVAGRVEQQFAETRKDLGTTLKSVQTGALQAVEGSGTAFWGLFGALLLGMLSAVLGATVGVTKRRRLWAETEEPAYVPEPYVAHPRP